MNRLRQLRLSCNLSTVELGKYINLDPSMITHIEKGRKQLSVDSLNRACSYFNVSADYLLGKSPEDMYEDFVSSIERNWRTVEFDSAGEPTQIYTDEVPPLLQSKFDIIGLMREIDDPALLKSVYEFLHSCVMLRKFSDDPDSENNYNAKLEKTVELVRLLSDLSAPALDVVLQTALLQKGDK